MKAASSILAASITLLLGVASDAAAQSSSSPYVTGYRYLDGGVLAGQINPAPSGTSNFPAIRNTYDSNGRLVKIETGVLAAWQDETVLPANWTGFTVSRMEQFGYDVDGRKVKDTLASATGTALNVTQFSYDPYNRMICTTVRMNATAFGSVPSDACTLGTAGSYGPDRVTENVYDDLNHIIQIRKAVGTSLEQAYATYSYTADGQQEYIIDANGGRSQQVYNGHDRLSNLYFPSTTQPSNFDDSTQATALATAGAINSSDYEAYGYDPNGNRTSLRKRDAQTINYTPDALNRVAVKDVPGGTSADVYYDYDNRGLTLDAKFSSLSGSGVSYGYDFAGRKTSETTYGQNVGYAYDADGNRTRVTWPDSYYVSYGLDGLNRMVVACENGSFNGNQGAPGCSSGVKLSTYGYDPLQRIQSVQYSSGTPAANVSYLWSPWDDLSTLTHNLAVSAGDVTFTDLYTPSHQIAQSTITNTTFQYNTSFTGTTGYVPNGLNQYASITPPGGPSTTIGYDANGNLQTDGTYTYVYDHENRLTSATKTGVSASYQYDPLGRRYKTVVTGGPYAGSTQFLDAGDDEIADYNSSGSLVQRYIPGRAVDQPIAVVTAAGTKTFFHQDKTGSVIAMSDANGNMPEGPYTYDPYGNCMVGGTVCTSGVPFKYTGRRFDPETGLYYYRARYYSPSLGRFMQTDPVGYTTDVNLYAYVGNDPANRMDPTGQASCDIPGTTNCRDIPRASPQVERDSIKQAQSQDVGKGKPEQGSVTLTSKKDNSVTRTLTGAQVGHPSRTNPQHEFDFDFFSNEDEITGVSEHDHAASDASIREVAQQTDARNAYPSKTDLQKTMNSTNAPVIVKGPNGTISETYRVGGVDHYVVLSGPGPTTGVPSDISHDFVVDPRP